MMGFSFKINKKYAFEISGLHKIRDLQDGVTFTGLGINLDLYKGDHNPKFSMELIILNFKVVEIGIYNINHVPEEE
jgi:hypothetical protein